MLQSKLNTAIYCTLIVLMFGMNGCKDPCDEIFCESGTCVDGSCECDLGYMGERCTAQKTPKSIEIKSVRFERIPPAVIQAEWDQVQSGDDYLPDIYLQIRSGISVQPFYESDVLENASATSYTFNGPFPLVEDPETSFRFALVDHDPGQLQDQEILWVLDYKLYYSKGGFPENIEFVFDDGTLFTIELGYNH